MGAKGKVDPEIEKLVQEVKAEMEKDGSRYVKPSYDQRYKAYPQNGKKIKPPFGMLLSKMMVNKPEPERNLGPGIQFRGTPRKRENADRQMLIKSNHDVIPLLRGDKKR